MSSHAVPDVDRIPLGRLPRPVTGPDLSERLVAGVGELFGGMVDGLDRLRVAATLDGPDVPTVDIDLTGLVIRVDADASAPSSNAPLATVAHRETGVLGTTSLQGQPVMVAEVPVNVDAVVHGLRFTWIEGTDGSVAVELQDPSADTPVTGQARVAVSQARLVDAVRRQATESLAAAGFTLASLDVHLDSHGPRSVGVQADARVRKGLLSASARVGATVDVGDDLVLTVRGVEATSRNPLVAGLLLAFRHRLEAVERERIDLAGELPPGVRIEDLRLDVGDELVLTARLA